MFFNKIFTSFRKKKDFISYKAVVYLMIIFNTFCSILISRVQIFFLKRFALIIGVIFLENIFFSSNVFAEAGCGDDANPGIKTICDIVMFLQGRIARSLIAFSVMLAAWSFVGGQFKWQEMLTLAIGIGMFYAPKTFALFLLPEYIQGITGDGYDISVKYTPDEIITCACPNLR